MNTKAVPDLEELDETEIAILQRDRLSRLREFLIDHDADDELVDAVDQAIEDNEDWISPRSEQYVERARPATTKKPQ